MTKQEVNKKKRHLTFKEVVCLLVGHQWVVQANFRFESDVWPMTCLRCERVGLWNAKTDKTEVVEEDDERIPVTE